MARIHGKNGQVLMDETGGSPYTPTAVGDINSFVLNLSTPLVDVTSFGDTNTQSVVSLPAYNGSLSGFYNSLSTPRLFDVVLGGVPVWLKLMPNTVEPTFYFHGLAYIDASLNVSATTAAAFTGNWTAAGNWSMMP